MSKSWTSDTVTVYAHRLLQPSKQNIHHSHHLVHVKCAKYMHLLVAWPGSGSGGTGRSDSHLGFNLPCLMCSLAFGFLNGTDHKNQRGLDSRLVSLFYRVVGVFVFSKPETARGHRSYAWAVGVSDVNSVVVTCHPT